MPPSLCPCMCVCQSLISLHDNSRPCQPRITKFERKTQNTLVKNLVVLEAYQLWPSRSDITFWCQFYPVLSLKIVCAINHHAFKLGSPILVQGCKMTSYCICRWSLDYSTVPTASQSQPSTHILILAAKGILAFNITLVHNNVICVI